LRLPESQNVVVAVSVVEVISDGECLSPVSALSICCTDNPRAGALIASITKRDTASDPCEAMWLFSNRELQPRGAGFERCGTKAARHGFLR
jgi:hypothetical protein